MSPPLPPNGIVMQGILCVMSEQTEKISLTEHIICVIISGEAKGLRQKSTCLEQSPAQDCQSELPGGFYSRIMQWNELVKCTYILKVPF